MWLQRRENGATTNKTGTRTQRAQNQEQPDTTLKKGIFIGEVSNFSGGTLSGAVWTIFALGLERVR